MPRGRASGDCERKGGVIMADEVIKNILLSLGLYSLAMAYVGSEAELIQMFKTDFDNLMRVCAEG
jgi:hypothetical protein